jgi:hypothetical protein
VDALILHPKPNHHPSYYYSSKIKHLFISGVLRLSFVGGFAVADHFLCDSV